MGQWQIQTLVEELRTGNYKVLREIQVHSGKYMILWDKNTDNIARITKLFIK